MDPLVVASGIGEFIDQRLIDGKPIADADFLAGILRKVRRPLEFDHRLSHSFVCRESSTRFTAAWERRPSGFAELRGAAGRNRRVGAVIARPSGTGERSARL